MTQATFYPTGPGSLTEISTQYPASGAHWDKVDEAVADEMATRVSMAPAVGTWQTDLFTFTPTVQGGLINYVRVYRRTISESRQPGKSKSAILVNGETTPSYSSIVDDAPGGAWQTSYYDWTVNPITSSRWTWSEFFTLQFGLSLYNGVYVNSYCTQCYLVVDYTLEDASDNIYVGML